VAEEDSDENEADDTGVPLAVAVGEGAAEGLEAKMEEAAVAAAPGKAALFVVGEAEAAAKVAGAGSEVGEEPEE
jgi:hypothetical protein